jgi:5-hydroxyisourate hydrolase-like protein (transthyretin family)
MRNFSLWRVGPTVQRQLRAWTLVACFSTAAQGGTDITGTVVNPSRGEPAAGDDVVLVQLNPWIEQEESRAKTDDHGRFILPVQ